MNRLFYHKPKINADVQRTVVKRSRILTFVFGITLLAILFRIFSLQVFGYQKYREKVMNEITTGAKYKATRGNIYDANGILLATDITVWRIYVSPVDIAVSTRRDGKDYGALIASEMANIFSLSYSDVYNKTLDVKKLDVTLVQKAEDNEKDAVLLFAEENGLTSMLHAEAGTARYYPYAAAASHVIGFTGSDNQGLFGLEAYYDDLLSGKDGKYLTERDATGKEINNGFSGFTEPISGNNIYTTLDMYLQRELELELSAALLNADAQNRVSGIVMNVNTGAILAMATLPSYNLNAPYTLDEQSLAELHNSGYDEGSAEYRAKRSELLYEMWNNKAISELYEPGSTFKIVTCATAIDLGVVSTSETFSCPGYYRVGGYNISCHKRGGHGILTFAEGLQQSCNPVMMQVAERIGSKRFYAYFKAFGYLEKTGIDLPSEATGIFHKESALGSTELATASFGQRFKVTPIAQICAVAAVANGGHTVTPHLFSYATDQNGNVTQRYEDSAPLSESTLSEETCNTIREILEKGVSNGGGAKNAYVAGYEVAAKTGTSEKFDILDENGRSYLRIGSCVAFAPASDPEIAVIIIVDEPTSDNKYGSVTAAPFVSDFLEDALPYLGYTPSYAKTEETVILSNYRGLAVSDAVKTLKAEDITCEVMGKGDTVIKQVPTAGTALYKENGRVLLYTDDTEVIRASVPNIVGKTAEDAVNTLISSGFNVCLAGYCSRYLSEGAVAVSQSLSPGTLCEKGTAVTVRILYNDETD